MNLKFRKAEFNDAKFVYDLRFLSDDKDSYFSVENIDFDSHIKFWERHYETYTIAVINNKRVGFYGFVKDDFRYAVAPERRGEGIGYQIIKSAMTSYNLKEAKVIKSNKPSLKCFDKAGFRIKENCIEDGKEYVILGLH